MTSVASVIVPTRNSQRTLRACLESIRAQTVPVELVVVDNGSSDQTAEIARELADVVLDVGPERSAQRNAGARAARSDRLLFVDSDMVLAPDVVEAALATNAPAVVIPEESFGEGFWARCKALERSCYLGDDTIEAARLFSRELFFAIGGYDEEIVMGCEDWDLDARAKAAGARIARAKTTIRHDEGRLRLRRSTAKKFHYGRSLVRYVRKHPALARRQIRLVRPAFVRHRGRLARQPLLTAGIVVMKCAEFGAFGAGAATAMLRGFRRQPGAGA